MKKLYKSKNNKVFTGVIGGLGEYFEIDPVIIRLFWVMIVIATGFFPGLIAYIIAILIVPERPDHSHASHIHNVHSDQAKG